MNRSAVFAVSIMTVLVAWLTFWFLDNFERRMTDVYVGYQGEAKHNSLLAARRFLRQMGIPAETLPSLLPMVLPPVDETLLITTSRSTLYGPQIDELLAWINRGGHLIVVARGDQSADEENRIEDELLEKLGVAVYKPELTAAEVRKQASAPINIPLDDRIMQINFSPSTLLENVAVHDGLLLRDNLGIRLIHAEYGKGYYTVVSDLGFITNEKIGKFDHAEFLWRLLHLDGEVSKVWLAHQEDMPPLWKWLWQRAWMVIISFALLIIAWICSRIIRFGPILIQPPPARKSLLEHIEASGRFLWRQGQQQRLMSGVEQALKHRLLALHPGWASYDNPRQLRILGEMSRLSQSQIQTVLTESPTEKPQHFAQRVQLLELIRKKL